MQSTDNLRYLNGSAEAIRNEKRETDSPPKDRGRAVPAIIDKRQREKHDETRISLNLSGMREIDFRRWGNFLANE